MHNLSKRLGYPSDPLGRLRWLYLVFLCGLVLPQAVHLAFAPTIVPLKLLAAAAVATLVMSWIASFRRARTPGYTDILDACAYLAMAIGQGDILPVLGVFYTSLYLRSFHGSLASALRHAFVYCGILVAGYAAASVQGVGIWVFTQFPTIVMVATVANLLARSLEQRTALEQRLNHQASHDSLTGLPNRAVFTARLDAALGRADAERQMVGVLLVDLDDFKVVNDGYGHAAGDQLLVAVAERLRRATRDSDLAVRLGGDEFAIVLTGLRTPSEAEVVAARLLAALHAPFSIAGRQVVVRASIGIATTNAKGERTSLLGSADLAMYAAKANGKDRYEVFKPEMAAASEHRATFEHELAGAVERGEFELHYQPIISLETRATVGVEALVRWRHPERGLISPAEFIPVAEATGLIRPLGRWILREACTQVRTWRDEFPHRDLRVSVNVSAKQLQSPDIAREVANALGESGLPASALNLELTENILMGDAPLAATRLAELKELGVRLSLDDFGTGYTSIAYLMRFPVGELKIDRSFVSKLSPASRETALVESLVALAGRLGLQVIAEGIETTEQAEMLRQIGCRLGQGYLYARPLPAHDLAKALRASSLQEDVPTAVART